VHVRVSVAGSEIDLLQPLRDDLVALVARYADVYGVRVKRRKISDDHAFDLMVAYEKRASAKDGAITETQKGGRRG
jgi:hypothetical protein